MSGADHPQYPLTPEWLWAFVKTTHLAVLFFEAGGELVSANPAALALLGMSKEDTAAARLWDLVTQDGAPVSPDDHPVRRALRHEPMRQSEVFGLNASRPEDIRWVKLSAQSIAPSGHPPTSGVYVTLEQLSEPPAARGLEQRWLDAFRHCAHGIALGIPSSNRILACNPAFAALQGRTVDEITSMPILSLYAPEDRASVLAAIAEADRVGRVRYDAHMQRKDGTIYPVQMDVVSVRDASGVLLYRVATQLDLTERRRADRQINQLNRLYATLSQINQAIVRVSNHVDLFSAICQIAVDYGQFQLAWIGLFDPQTGVITPAASSQLLHCQGLKIHEPPHNDGPLSLALRQGITVHVSGAQAESLRCWGSTPEIHFKAGAVVPLRRGGQVVGLLALYAADLGFFTLPEEIRLLDEIGIDVSFALDLLEREERRARADVDLAASESALKKSQAVAHVGHWSWDTLSNTVTWSDEMHRIFGVEPGATELDLTDVIARAIHPDDRERVNRANTAVIDEQAPAPMEYRVIWPDGTIRTVWAQPGEALRNASGEIVRLTGIVQDITGRKADEIRIQQQAQHLKLQVERLKALRAIDLMITANFDIRPTLIALLDQVIARLNVDAAAVLLFNEGLQTLDFAAGRGFRSRVIEQTRLLLGQGYAGRAGFERVTVVVPDLQAVRAGNARAPLLADEDCHAYCGVPLIAKGRLVGVLEIFQRTPLPEDPDWLEFLETLAGQAAIAIDNAHLFDDLQRTNAELRLAYDATIEGWSHAMDLRDRETEGHSRRVTDLTVRLAEAAGLGTEQITHARRGALLHDIGKLGIPDRILFKADTLTDDEWAVMRKHPQYAFDMLSSIEYLRPALDIPYCHHEKWDGTGYPRGLRGEQIPLAARIFMVADVWDALRSDRPYRRAWPEADVLDFIRRQSGSHFDPMAVSLFFKVVLDR